MKKVCKVEKCNRPVKGYGYCEPHYRRYKKYGSPFLCHHERDGLAKANPYIHKSWIAMKRRCYNKNAPEYPRYGGRGIKVCDRWAGTNGFRNFYEDMAPRPIGYSLDRIDPNGDYSPENCRWASPSQQNNNRRDNKNIEYNGRTQTIAQWERELDYHRGTLQRRIRDGWDIHKALSTPSKGSHFLGKKRK